MQEQIQNQPIQVLPGGEAPVSPLYKKLFMGLMFLFLLIGITGGAYYFGRMQSVPAVSPTPTQAQTQISITPSATPTIEASISPTAKIAKDEDIVPVGPNTVSFARVADKTYLRYRGKIYDDTDQNSPHEVILPNPDQYTWYGLADTPAGIPAGQFMLDEVFGYKVAPDKNSFAFVMRWGTKPEDVSYYLYSYMPFLRYRQSILMKKFTPGSGGSYNVAKIDQFSPDIKYISLHMFGCWNCGGHQPETLLIRIDDNETKNIGKTSYFAWKENGAYEYKEYKVIPCVGESMGECSEKPENLPLKTGQF